VADLILNEQDEAILSGSEGEGAQLAMRILARMAPVYGACELLDISAAHIDSSVYMGPSSLAFAERLADSGAKVRVPSTLNVAGIDEHGWSEWAVPKEWAEGSKRQMDAYRAMGCIQTWTCAPYQTEFRPSFGDQIASGESNVIAFYNSVIGARTERYPDMLDICAAITGRAPASGLHLDENRAATRVVDVDGIPDSVQRDEAFWPTLGVLIGTTSPDRVVAVTGVRATPTEDQLKAVSAGAASFGATALFHLVGVTPEAKTLADACQGREPDSTDVMDLGRLRKYREQLSTHDGNALDVVLLGSPHFSIREFQEFAALAGGRRLAAGVTLIITCSRAIRDIVRRTAFWDAIAEFGASITVDACPLVSPMLRQEERSVMTNSAKYAFYSPGLLTAGVRYGTLADCVESAVNGRVVVDDAAWETTSPGP